MPDSSITHETSAAQDARPPRGESVAGKTTSLRCPRVWIVSEIYYPETTSTGHILTGIAEGLAANRSVRVLCGQPNYSARGIRAPRRESRNGVEIERCWGTTWDKDSLWKRLVNMATISGSFLVRLPFRLRRGDVVLAPTNPPSVPFIAALACRLRGAKLVTMIQDKYPEAAFAAGLLRRDSLFAKALLACARLLYRSSDRIAVVGRDIQELVRRQVGGDAGRVVFISDWGDVDEIRPQPRSESRLLGELGLSDKFVVLCAGNMGPLHDAELLVRCALELGGRTDIHFVVAGSGKKKAWLESAVQRHGLANVSLLPPFPRSESANVQNACDAALSVFVPGMLGVSVPSRAYNTFAAGKPIIAVSDPDSELARVVRDEGVGWTSPPGDLPAFVRTVEEAASTPPDVLAEMGRRARALAERDYTLSRVVEKYARLVDELLGTR